MAYTSSTTAQTGAVPGRVLTLIEELKAKFDRYRLYRQTLNELSALGNRELADLGLNRSMLKRVAYQAAQDAG